jgi:hypothetical protein
LAASQEGLSFMSDDDDDDDYIYKFMQLDDNVHPSLHFKKTLFPQKHKVL